MKSFILSKFFITLSALALVALAVLFVLSKYEVRFRAKNGTTDLRFKNVGELATQSVICTEVGSIEKDKRFFDLKIPFTQSKYIYTIGFKIKAGFDFSKIEMTENRENKTVTVYLPQPYIISGEPLYDTFKIYHESESVFTPISLHENVLQLGENEKQAEADAVANGLFENATENAKALIYAHLSQIFDMREYRIIYQ